MAKNVLGGLLPDNIYWDGKVGAVLDVSEFVGTLYQGGVTQTAVGNGRNEFLTVPSGELWILMSWWCQAVLIDVTDIKCKLAGETSYGIPLFVGTINGAGGSAEDGEILPQPIPLRAGSKISYYAENDAGADVVTPKIFYRRYRL